MTQASIPTPGLLLSRKRAAPGEGCVNGLLLVKEWGRIGEHGRMAAEPYDSEVLAAVALRRHAERKRRRGYKVSRNATEDHSWTKNCGQVLN